jgi:hypothetical protein
MVPKEFRKMAAIIATISAAIGGGGVHLADGQQQEVDRSTSETLREHMSNGHPWNVIERTEANKLALEGQAAAFASRIDRMEKRITDRLRAIEGKL